MINSLNVVTNVFSNTLIFLLQKCEQLCTAKATHNFFAAKHINVFAMFHDRNFIITLSNNFVKF